MSPQDSTYASGAIEQPAAAKSRSTAPVSIAICCLVIILALVLGVGLASNLVLRHIVQTVPLWIGVALGFRRSRATSWVGLPLFLFWLTLMALIWSYLLGISHLLSGHFSRIEISMTIIVGAAAIIGIASFVRLESFLSLVTRVSLFVVVAVIQWVCFRLSFLPAIAHR
jgi:hypothetical protein